MATTFHNPFMLQFVRRSATHSLQVRIKLAKSLERDAELLALSGWPRDAADYRTAAVAILKEWHPCPICYTMVVEDAEPFVVGADELLYGACSQSCATRIAAEAVS